MMLGFVILGWPTKEKELGEIAPSGCPHCENSTRWHLLKRRTWVTVFWIPTIPLEQPTYHAICEICGAGIELTDDETEAAKELVETTEEFVSGDVAEADYINEIDSFWRLIDDEEPQEPDTDAHRIEIENEP